MSGPTPPSRRAPLSGYNHNVRFGDRVYHVQTEDSGIDRPHLVTHLFLEGSVVATLRSEYGHLLANADHADQVREMMQAQHKEILYRLRRGELDPEVAARSAAAPHLLDDASAQERTSVTRGRLMSRQSASLLGNLHEVPDVPPEFGAIPFIELSGDDSESLELDLEAIARLELAPRPLASLTLNEAISHALEADPDEWDQQELTPAVWDGELQDLLSVTVVPSSPRGAAPGSGGGRAAVGRGFASRRGQAGRRGPGRERPPSLPAYPPAVLVDERVFRKSVQPGGEDGGASGAGAGSGRGGEDGGASGAGAESGPGGAKPTGQGGQGSAPGGCP